MRVRVMKVRERVKVTLRVLVIVRNSEGEG